MTPPRGGVGSPERGRDQGGSVRSAVRPETLGAYSCCRIVMPRYKIARRHRLCYRPLWENVAGHNKPAPAVRRRRGVTLPAVRTIEPDRRPGIPPKGHKMRKGLFALAAAGLLATGSVAACGDSTEGGTDTGSGAKAGGKVGVILPDTKSSARWATADLTYLKAAF